MSARVKVVSISTAVVIAIVWWIVSPGWGNASYGGHSINYWFSQYLRSQPSGEPFDDPATQEARSQLADQSRRAFSVMGTNAVPFLLSQALRPSQRFDFGALVQNRLGRFAYSWNPPRTLSQEEISEHAVELIGACQADASMVVPTLAVHLTGTNEELHLRALRILSHTIGTAQDALPYITKDFGSTNPLIASRAFEVVGNPHRAKLALPHLSNYLKPFQPRSGLVLWIINMVGREATSAVPVLKDVFNSETNWETRRELAETLRKVDIEEARRLLPALKAEFDSETNLDAQVALGLTLHHVDREQPDVVEFFQHIHQQDSNFWYRRQGLLYEILIEFFGTNVPPPDIPSTWFRFTSPPFGRWLELGEGVDSAIHGPALEQWLSRIADREPQWEGLPLSHCLTNMGPGSPWAYPIDSKWDGAKAMHAAGTNAIPWLFKWIESTNTMDHLLARRGFGILQDEALCAVPALIELTQSDVPDLRYRIYGVLRGLQLDWTNLWPALVPVLHNPESEVRTKAAEYLYREFPAESQRVGLKDFISPQLIQ